MSHRFEYPPVPSQGRRIVLWKRDTSGDDQRAIRRRASEQMFRGIFAGTPNERITLCEPANKRAMAVDGYREPETDGGSDEVGIDSAALQSDPGKWLADLASLLAAASNGEFSQRSALHWLLNSKRGRSLARAHYAKQQQERKDTTPMTKKLEDLPDRPNREMHRRQE